MNFHSFDSFYAKSEHLWSISQSINLHLNLQIMFLSKKNKSEKTRGRGRPAITSAEEYKEKFDKYEAELFVDGDIAKLNSAIYQQIADELHLKSIGANKSVYQTFKRYVNKNKPSVSDQKYDSDNSNKDNSDAGQIDSESVFTIFDPNFKILQDDIKYDINIANINLFSYSDDEMKLQSEWSDTLNDIIWNFSRLPCAWRFDKHKSVANEKIVFGSCRSIECKANLFVYTECNQSKLKIVIKNFNPDAIHIEKRALKHSNKQKIAELLKINKPSYVHAEVANELLESSDYCPAHMPNKNTLRKLKQRENEKSLRDPDPVYSLCMLKKDAAFHRSITDIGLDPFYCFFSTPEQTEWLRLSTRYKRCVISVDSTGNQFVFFGF